MSEVSARLAELAITLPKPIAPIGSYVAAKRMGEQIGTSGQLPIDADGVLATGRLGAGVDVAAGQRAARVAVLNALAAAAELAGGIDQIAGVDKVVVFVNSAPDFTDQALVANGASDCLGEIFGEAGRHIRSAVGVAALPKDAAVEVELVVRVR